MLLRGLGVLVSLALLIVRAPAPGAASSAAACPTKCSCRSNTVDCSNAGLTKLPEFLPRDTVKLDLSKNKLTSLTKAAVENLPYLRILQLDNNEIQCIDGEAFSLLPQLVSITLHNNNLTGVPSQIREHLPRLQSLRLEQNPLKCDCWLNWLLEYDTLATLARCAAPYNLSGKRIAELKKYDLKCTGSYKREACTDLAGPDLCPQGCKCNDGIVDCRNRGLVEIPRQLPADVTEIRLEQNQITEIPPAAFTAYPRLKRIDLSNNEIKNVAADAFRQLKSLKSLVLYGNKITHLPSRLFDLLNSNLLLKFS
jgi:slit protein 2